MKVRQVAKYLIGSFALALIMATALPEMHLCAADRVADEVVETRYIRGDGVRLRKEGWTGGTVLELMYDGEQINYYPDIYGSDSEYNYMQRLKTGTYGFVDHHYTRMQK